MPRPEREMIHLITAWMWSERSHCRRNQNGCVIASPDLSEILTFGYNGPGRGLPHDRCEPEKVGDCGCLHAEDNALNRCRRDTTDAVAFCTTAPCRYCAQRFLNARIAKVYYSLPYRNDLGLDALAVGDVPSKQVPFNDAVAQVMYFLGRLQRSPHFLVGSSHST